MKKSQFTEEQIVRILQEAASGHDTIGALCRKHGVTSHTFYIWRRKCAGMEKDDVHQLRELERENAQLKKLVAELHFNRRPKRTSETDTVRLKLSWWSLEPLRPLLLNYWHSRKLSASGRMHYQSHNLESPHTPISIGYGLATRR